MSKSYKYYSVDAGHFKVQVKLCFDKKEFKNILDDHNIQSKAEALETGIAETHYFAQGAHGVIVLVFDLKECDESPAYLAGCIAHEATHCVCRIFEHIGEDVEDIGEESRAYLTEHIVTQLTQAVITEKEKNARKTNRAAPKQKGKGAGRPKLQVDQHGERGSGPDSYTQGPPVASGAEDAGGQGVSKARVGVSGAGDAGVSGVNHSQQN